MYTLEDIARTCWEVNRAGLQVADTEECPDEPWDAAPEWRKQLMQEIVSRIYRGQIRDARGAHEFWCTMMEKEGWRWGERKEPGSRIHPHLRMWKDLNAEEQLAKEFTVYITTKMSAASILRSMEP